MRNRKILARWVSAVASAVLLFAGAAINGRHMSLYGQGQGSAAWPKENAPSGPVGFGLPLGLGGLAVSPDGKTVAAGQNNFHVGIWDAHSGKLLSSLQGHSATVTAVAYAPDGKTLYSGSMDGSIVAWNLAAGGTPQQLEGKSAIVGLALSADGKSLFVRTDAQKLLRYELATGLLRGEIALAATAR